jgi:hypothetical protein
MKFRVPLKLIIFGFVLILVIAACNQEPSETPEATTETTGAETQEAVDISSVELIPLVDNENGLILQYPDGWVTKSGGGGATVASAQSVIDAESLGEIGDEAFVVIIPGEIDVFSFQTSQSFTGDDVLSVLETYKQLLEGEGQSYVVVLPPETFTKNNQNMGRMVLRSTENEQPIITVMAVVMGEEYMALVSAASHQDKSEEFRPIFYRIIDSIEVGPPSS